MLSNAGSSILLYRLAIARCVLFSVVTLCGAIMAALAGTVWINCDAQTKFLICISIMSTWGGTIMAFLDQSMKRAQEGKDPITGVSLPPFASQAQVDAGLSKTTMVSPATLANTPAVKAADEQPK